MSKVDIENAEERPQKLPIEALARRNFLTAAAAGLTLSACSTQPNLAATPTASAPAFVLVHGAWHGGWCWQRVHAELVSKGHRVYAQSLTGLADRSHLLHRGITLETHVRDVVNLIEWEGLDSVVLCGHSYGGMVITGAAERLLPRLKAIVYLDAFVPESANMSMLDLVGPASRAKREAIVEKAGDGYLPPISAETMRVNTADRLWVDSKLTPHPFKTWRDGLPSIDAHERVANKVYVRATGMPSLVYDRTANERRSRQGWTVVELPFGHDLMVDAPRQVAEILTNASIMNP